MQKLIFERAWDKTIAPADREKITTYFNTSQINKEVHLAFFKEAINYKNERLVTVLIHNGTTEPVLFQNTAIAFDDRTGLFTVPLQIPAQSSMPWTFIFSNNNETELAPAYTIS